MAGQDVPAGEHRGLICGFDGGSVGEFIIDRPVAYWEPEKYAVALIVNVGDGWRGFGAIWHSEREPNPLEVGYESSDRVRYELYELTTQARLETGQRTAAYVFKERL